MTVVAVSDGTDLQTGCSSMGPADRVQQHEPRSQRAGSGHTHAHTHTQRYTHTHTYELALPQQEHQGPWLQLCPKREAMFPCTGTGPE